MPCHFYRFNPLEIGAVPALLARHNERHNNVSIPSRSGRCQHISPMEGEDTSRFNPLEIGAVPAQLTALIRLCSGFNPLEIGAVPALQKIL